MNLKVNLKINLKSEDLQMNLILFDFKSYSVDVVSILSFE